jgi:protein O-mannosyl-transferase
MDDRVGRPVLGRLAAHPALICALLAATTMVVFWPVVHHDFINYDDDLYVTANRHVQAGLTWQGLAWAFGRVHGQATYWHPLTWVSHMIDCEVFGTRAGGHHLVNLLIHTLNTVLVFVVLRRMTGAFWRCALVAGLFALHPLQVDTVAWVAERKNLLGALFWLLTMWAYVAYAAKPGLGRYVLMVVLYAMGLMCKPVLVTLPFVLLLLDYWPLQRLQPSSLRRLVLEKMPLFALAALSSLITLMAHHDLGSLNSTARLPLEPRMENAIVSYVRYLEKVAWPFNLSVFYPYHGSWPMWKVALCGVCLLGACWAAVRAARSHPSLLVGWLWFLGVLVPFIGLVQAGAQAMADRFMYVPLIGLSILLIWGAAAVVERLHLPAGWAAVLGGSMLALCALRTTNQLSYWQNSEALFQHAIAVTEGNFLAFNNVGVCRFNEKHFDEAIAYFQKSLQFAPAYADALDNMGAALEAQGKPEAIEWYRKAIQAEPTYADALYNLGNQCERLGRFSEAAAYFEAVLRVRPDHYKARNNLGNVLNGLGRLDEAATQYRLALELQPDSYPIHRNLGAVLAARGRLDEAIFHYRQALRQEPKEANLHYQLGLALALQSKWSEAIEQYNEALQLARGSAEVEYNLGYALRMQGRPAEAATHLEEALRLKPEFPLAHYNLGCVLAEQGRRDEAVSHLKEALRLKPDYREARDKLRAQGVPLSE